MILPTVLSGLILLGAGFGQSDAPTSVASEPEAVHPLLPGMTAPDVTLRTVEGEPVPLSQILSRRPTVLVFYRGGW